MPIYEKIGIIINEVYRLEGKSKKEEHPFIALGLAIIFGLMNLFSIQCLKKL